MKQCFKCGDTKPEDEFYTHPAMADGRLGKCKECARADVRENRARNREHYVAFDRKRASLPHRVDARKEYARSERGKEVCAESHRRYRARNPEKYAAHKAVQVAIQGRRVIKPSHCSECGEFGRIHAHHEDYSRPLDVVWLCPACHRARHGERKQEAAQ